MHDSSIFRTILIEFTIESFVEELILFVTIKTPVTFGIIVVTTIGVETEPFFSKTTVVVISDVVPAEFVTVDSFFSVKYVTVGLASTITKTSIDDIQSSFEIKFFNFSSTAVAYSVTDMLSFELLLFFFVVFDKLEIEEKQSAIINAKQNTQAKKIFLFFL